MIRIAFLFSLILGLSFSQHLSAQSGSKTHVNTDINIDKEISDLMNELELNNDQKLYIGMLILKYSLEFDFKEFEDASKVKQYSMAKSKIKELDKELKVILTKQQFKTYKRHKRELKKELKGSV